jgi:hypothetical protein
MRILLATGAALALVVSASAELRTWTDNTGKHKTEAEFVSLNNEKVTLRKANGKTISVPLSRLSDEDQKLAESLAAKQDSSTEDANRPTKYSRPNRGGIVNNVRAAPLRTQSMNKLKQICLALINYEQTNGRFPTAAIKSSTGSGLSWRVAILPYLEEQSLYRRFRLNEPWDSPHNEKLIPLMPSVFMSPGGAEEPGWTNYLAVVGDNSVIVDGTKGIRATDVRDGLSKTIVVVEADDKVSAIWTKPEEYAWDPSRPTVGLGGIWPGYFLAGFGDASVRRVHLDSIELINGLFSRNGRETVTLDE